MARGCSCSPEPLCCTPSWQGHRCLVAGSCQPVPCSSCSCFGQEQWWEQGWEPQPSSCCGGFSSPGQRPAAVTPAELLVPSHTHLCENPCPSMALATLLSWKKQLVCAAGCLPGQLGTFPRRSGAAGGCSKPGTSRGDLSWENAPAPGVTGKESTRGHGHAAHCWLAPARLWTCPRSHPRTAVGTRGSAPCGVAAWGQGTPHGSWQPPPKGSRLWPQGTFPLPTRLPCRQPHLAHTNPGIFLPVP